MSKNRVRRFVSGVTLSIFTATHLAGCLAVQNNSGMASIIVDAATVVAKTQSGRSPQFDQTMAVLNSATQQRAAQQPQSIVTPGHSASEVRSNLLSMYRTGVFADARYASAEFQKRNNRFKVTKSAVLAARGNFTERQFMELAIAVKELVVYIDAIESRKAGLVGNSAGEADGWSRFYSESIAQAAPQNPQALLSTADALSAAFDSQSMLAANGYLSSEAPRANLPQVSGKNNTGRPPISAVPCATGAPCDGASRAKEEKIKAAVMEDLVDLGRQKVFSALTTKNSFTLKQLGKVLRSPASQALITSLPVVGNLMSFGMLLSGTNLDGSKMNGYDYTGAAIGMIPVVGNIARHGPRAMKALANGLDKTGPLQEVGQWVATIGGSETMEAYVENNPQAIENVTAAITRRAVDVLPDTKAFFDQNGIRI